MKVPARLLIISMLSLSLAFASAFFQTASSSSEIKINLKDKDLEKECDWAMYLDVQDMQKYLTYQNSKLHPLTRVRVSFRLFPRTSGVAGTGAGATSVSEGKSSESKTFEELWYHHRTPIGSRRYMKPVFPDESLGIIVLGPSSGKKEHREALGNALIRLMVDLQFQQAKTSMVLVPERDYEEIAEGLRFYNFSSDFKLSEGKRMSIRLCSNSSTKEGYFYYLGN